jgi:replicative DNA helicase
LTRVLSGALMPGLHVVHGGPGVGKTAFALQVAACCEAPALFVSCEISPLEILRRLAARVNKIPVMDLKTGEMRPEEVIAYARRACEKTPLLSIADGTKAYPSPEWIRQRAEEVRGKARHILVVIDSLHTWATRSQSNATEYEALNAGLASLELLAGRLMALVLVIAERNKGGMRDSGQHATKGSGRIAYAGESVIGLDIHGEEEADLSGEKTVQVRVDKNRHGESPKTLYLRFHGDFQRFREE